MLCPYCKEEIADGALKCKHCESMLTTPPVAASPSAIPQKQPPPPLPMTATAATTPAPKTQPTATQTMPMWTSVLALILGVIGSIKYVVGGYFYYNEVLGYLALGSAAIVFAIVSLAKKHRGKGVAIAGLVVGGFGFFYSIWFLS